MPNLRVEIHSSLGSFNYQTDTLHLNMVAVLTELLRMPSCRLDENFCFDNIKPMLNSRAVTTRDLQRRPTNIQQLQVLEKLFLN